MSLSANEVKITVLGVRDEPGTVGAIFRPLASADIDVSMIVQDLSRTSKGDDGTDVTFTVEQKDKDLTLKLIADAREEIGFREIIADEDVVRVSVIGMNLEKNTGMAQIMFDALGKEGINIQAISTSEVKISVLVANEFAERAVRALHSAYILDAR
ncbi:MAG: ACT domain-containing protein [Sphingomonadales bacterium]|nr:ACT domain-containing protein [Sphingomonadales bacterium]